VVIIDTSIWIPALGARDSPEMREVEALVEADEAALVGIILAEVLRGSRSTDHLERLRRDMAGAEFIGDDEESWLLASRIMLDLKLRGQTIPLPDAMIAAQALQGSHAVYSHDEHFRRIPGLRLHAVGSV